MTLTFKRFLESNDPLLDLEYLMIIRKIIPGLSNDEAQEVLDWTERADADFDGLPDWVANKVATSDLAETDYYGDDITQEPDHIAGHKVRRKIWRKIRDISLGVKGAGHIAESQNPLLTTSIEMFFRLEMDMPAEAAYEATLWIEGDKKWRKLEHDARDMIMDYVEANLDADIIFGSTAFVEAHVRSLVKKLMLHKYDISLDDQ